MFAQTLKNMLRPVARPFLNRFRLIIQEELAAANPARRLDSPAAAIENLRDEVLPDWLDASLNNALLLADNRAGRLSLRTPWRPRKHFYLAKNQEGKLSFTPLNKGLREAAVHISSIPKAGTYFVVAIFRALNFEDVQIHSIGNQYADSRGLTPEQRTEPSRLYYVNMPFATQAGLVLPGQHLAAHLADIDELGLAKTNGLKNILLVVRDLRYVLVSFARFMRTKHLERNNMSTEQDKSIQAVTSDALRQLFTQQPFLADFVFQAARFCAALKNDPAAQWARYEELTSGDRRLMEPSLLAISRVAGCEPDEVYGAVLQAAEVQTPTFFKEHSRLEHIWNDEIEALFKKMGGDILNAQLGYDQDFLPPPKKNVADSPNPPSPPSLPSLPADVLELRDTATGKYHLPRNAPRDIIANAIKNNDVFERPIYETAQKYIRENSVVLDIGSNFGQMAIMMSKHVGPRGQVHAFEAEPFVYDILLRNIEINQARVTPHFGAVHHTGGETAYFPEIDLSKYGTYGSYGIDYKNKTGRPTPCLAIDDLGLENISFMKIDVQGGDLFVLQGAKKTIMRCRMPIIFEYEYQFEEEQDLNFQAYVDFVSAIGYRFSRVLLGQNYLILPE